MDAQEAADTLTGVLRALATLNAALLPGPPVALFGKEYRWLDLRPHGDRLHLIREPETGETDQ